jgi:hydroxyethylthiazole kinase
MGERSALVHHITNWVTINDCAQITRHWGCLPVMAHAIEEVEEMAGLAGALVLNIGTLTMETIDSMVKAAKAANQKGIPVVLDAVGAGATRMRTEAVQHLMVEAHMDVIKGNAGEIATLAGVAAEVRGVESISVGGEVSEFAKGLAQRMNAVVAVTGAADVVSDGKRTLIVETGDPMMGRVVGTGCIGTSTVGCFVSAGPDYLEKTALALGAFGLAGEKAARAAAGPGDFMAKFMNAICAMCADSGPVKIEMKEV